MLRRFGAKWAVLAAMAADMAKKGIDVLGDVVGELQTARVKIASGCYSPCEAACDLAHIESQLSSRCDLLPPHEFQEWCDLLAEAMQGKLDYQRIRGIAALEPIRNDCGFLSCGCSSAT
jgi:hypothetical protein